MSKYKSEQALSRTDAAVYSLASLAPLSAMTEGEIDERIAPVRLGRQIVLDDLARHPDRAPEYYAHAAAACLGATLMPNGRASILQAMAEHSPMEGSTKDATAFCSALADELDALRIKGGVDHFIRASAIGDVGIGIAQITDELYRARGDTRAHPGGSVQNLLFQRVQRFPELDTVYAAKQAAFLSSQVVTIARPSQSGDAGIGTASDLVEAWLDSKMLSENERSRQGSSAKRFIEAMGLIDETADRLAEIGNDAARRFAAHPAGSPLKGIRGQRDRIKHIDSFLAYARRTIAVPMLDWPDAHN